MGKAYGHILITTSVPEEAAGIKKMLDEPAVIHIGRRTACTGRIENASIVLLVTGPGMVNTAQSLTAAIERCIPETILMTGCAGAFAQAGMKVGDIGIAISENDVHLGLEAEERGKSLQPLPFDIGELDGLGVKHQVQADRELSLGAFEILNNRFLGDSVNIISGPFITVSTITATDSGARELYARFNPCMENMEGFAAAYIAGHYGIPFLEMRCASNLVGKRERDLWNIPLACERSALAAVAWLRHQPSTRNNE